MSYAYDQSKVVLHEVNTKTATMAELRGNPKLATQPHHQDLLKNFFDTGVIKIAARAGIIRGEYGENSPKDNSNPAQTTDPLVPPELLQCLVLWVLHEWYALVDSRLGKEYEDKYEKEFKDHRFSPGTAPSCERPFSPL